jgi:hypothetical protein
VGSSGRDRISDYPPSARDALPAAGSAAGPAGPAGGDPCTVDIDEVELEDVANGEYTAFHGSLPPRGTEVELSRDLHGSRLAVVTVAGGERVGVLPVHLNYLRACLEHNRYVGNVTTVSTSQLSAVWVELRPEQR